MKLRVFKSSEGSKKHIYDQFVFRNVVVLNMLHKTIGDFAVLKIKDHIKCEIWKVEYSNDVPKDCIYLNQIQRIYYEIALNDEIYVSKYTYVHFSDNKSPKSICAKLSSFGRKMPVEYLHQNFSDIVSEISKKMMGHVVIGRQPFCINHSDYNFKIEIADAEPRTYISNDTVWTLTQYNGANINVASNLSIIINDVSDLPLTSWNLKNEGVGGLKNATQELFRRAFSSRQNPQGANKLGTQHVRGVLLFGPPGCGKTLIARKLAELLSKKIPPKIVSGPEIFDKYVGGSSEKIRNLFIDAESDEKKLGPKSPLHVIIFDEFDSIGAKRSNGDGTADNVGNQVVNQLLAKIEGPEQLNNVLLIAMTNRKDAIDKALLRPGRFEVHIEIKLPTLDERKEIIEIHCSTMIENGAIEDTVDVNYLAKKTHNFTGAEINGLIKSAASYALARTIDINDDDHKISINSSSPLVTVDDFEMAFCDIRPQFGIQQHRMFQKDGIESDSESGINREIETENSLSYIYANYEIAKFIEELQTLCVYMDMKQMTIHEKKVGKFALDSGIDCLMCIDYFDMIGMNESQKCLHIKDMYIEASKTSNSLVVINDANTIIGYNNYNNYFSGPILQTIITLMRYYKNVKTIVTFTVDMKMNHLFDVVITI